MKIKIGRLVLLPLAVTALTGCDFFGIFGGDKKEETGITLKDYSQTAVKDSTYEYDGKVFLQYADSTEEDVTSKATFDYSTLDLSKTGKTSYKVKYEGQQYIWTTTATIEVVTASLELSNYSTFCMLNTTYTFDGTATLKLSNGATEDVTSKAVVDSSKVKTNVEGTYEVKVSYSDSKAGINVSKTFNLKVGEHTSGSLKSIVASGYTTSVWVGETYTFDGVVTANYNESGSTSQEVVTTKCVFGSIDTSSYGNKSLSISYTDSAANTKNTSVTIEVMAHVTGIDASDVEVGLNKTKSIGAKATPSYAKYTGLNYVSNNTGIATVDGSGVVTGKAIGNTTITISSKEAGSTVSKTINVSVAEIVGDEWTILIYMSGNNLESDYASSNQGAATDDLREIASVSGQPDDVNVVVQAGGASKWSSTYSSVIKTTTRNRIHLKNKTYVRDDTSTQAKENMGEEATLKSFIKWGIETYPADKIGLIFWNHGGAMAGCCGDEQYSDDYLMNDEIVRAIRAAKSETGYSDKFEFIGYDCCLMQVQDIAGTNSEFAKYMVASEASEWGNGWTYNTWIDDVFTGKSTETILNAIVDGFEAETNSQYSAAGESNDQTLSYMNLSYWSAYQTAWDDMITAININSSSAWSTFTGIVSSSFKFENGSYDTYDVGSFLTKMQSSSYSSAVKTKASAVSTVYSNLVAKTWHGDDYTDAQVTGLCLFCPIKRSISKSDYTEDATPFGAYRTACTTYGSWGY